jgi:FKBP-type peptidyl-prolyl cis-trans isomerase FkpA
MSTTAVPLHPIAKGSLTKLWVGVATLALAAGGLSWAGMRDMAPAADAFLSDNSEAPGVVTTQSGLQYQVIKQGTGASPAASDVALVAYKGTLLDGTVFDQNENAAMPVDGVVPGFSEALQLMKKGGEYRIWLPPELAYGDQVPEGGPIPPNAVLSFDVKLLEFKSKAEIMQMQQEMQRLQMQGGPAQ